MGLLKRVMVDGDHNEQSIRMSSRASRWRQSNKVPPNAEGSVENGSPAEENGEDTRRLTARQQERLLLQRLLQEVEELRAELRAGR